jgi:hypothetical protein
MAKEPETRSVMLRVRLRPSTRAKLERLARASHRSMSNFLEALIEEQEDESEKPRRK